MKKLIYSLAAAMVFTSAWASDSTQKGNVAKTVEQLQNLNTSFVSVNLLSPTNLPISDNIARVVKNASIFNFNSQQAFNAIDAAAPFIKMSLPIDGVNKEVLLYESDILTSDFKVSTSKSEPEEFQINGSRHYRGIIDGDLNSLAAISIFKDEVMGFVSTKNGNYTIGKIKNDPALNHIVYNDNDLLVSSNFACGAIDKPNSEPDSHESAPIEKTTKCVRMYWEANYDIFLNKITTANAANYLIGLFNQSATIYSNDGITVSLSEVFVWNSPSVYSAFSSFDYLTQFQNYRTTFNGDDAQLLSFDGGYGGVAYIDGLCSSFNYCYSGIYDNYSNVPVYSWSVMVVTHEQGHNFSSPHTHNCSWNGNNTAIDNCGPTAGYGYEGGCSGAPTPVGGGTIMSYCHLLGVGINFSQGFGPQPAAKIIDKIENASCLASCSVACTDNYEPNNSSATSTLLSANSTINGLIDISTDKDWFRFKNTTSQSNIKVTLSGLPANYNLKLYKGSVLVGQSSNTGTANDEIIYNTSVVGTYKVRVVGASGASNNSQCYTLTTQISGGAFAPLVDDFFAENSSAINANDEEMNVFPNPANNSIQFFIPANDLVPTNVCILDKLGRVVEQFKQTASSNNNTIVFDVSHLSSGLYFVQMVQGDKIISKKQVITH
jgi:Metallo-peptidase family M12/Secretion system C-terminal sorting domain